MKGIFLEKSYTKCGGDTILDLFWIIKIEHTSLDQLHKVLYSLFLLHAENIRTIKIY